MDNEHDRWARLGRAGPLVAIDGGDDALVVLRVQLPDVPSSATVARALVAALLERRGTEATACADVVLAVSEASSNAIEYSVGGHVDMCVEVTGDRCLVSVRNRVDRERATDTDPHAGAAMPSVDAVRGRGVAIIELVMDDVTWDLDGEQCVVEMFRQLRPAS